MGPVPILALVGAAIFAVLMVKAGIGDLQTMQIRNRLVLLLLGIYVVMAPLAGLPLAYVAASLAAGTAVLVLGIGLFALGWFGGGDAKLLAVAALWLGADHVLPFFVHTAFAGGILALLVILLQRSSLPAGWRAPEWAERLRSPGTGLPYGVAIASGALLVLTETPWLKGAGF